MEYNITELLTKHLNTDPKHICVNITTITDLYNLCFIEYEDPYKIGAYITGDDGRERFIIINKEQIVAIQVIYEQDLQIEPKNEDIMVV
jgi:hypothetical protein